ncbi:MAG: YraN family protein [Bacteroidales bacterium]|nr:YraN family protein [Bacteroidales bacterium]
MAESHDFGTEAESFAAEFLTSRGYCILHRNWTHGHKELDIVCTDGRMLVIVEVKARVRNSFPHPEDLLSPSKEKLIMEASEQYLYHHRVRLPVRFDLVSVIKCGESMDIEHFEDAFIPGVE